MNLTKYIKALRDFPGYVGKWNAFFIGVTVATSLMLLIQGLVVMHSSSNAYEGATRLLLGIILLLVARDSVKDILDEKLHASTTALMDSHNAWREAALEYIDSLEKHNAAQAAALRKATDLVTTFEKEVKNAERRN